MWVNYLPDVICFYRMAVSILALVLGKSPLAPWLFSTALISDLFDGYIFRKYTKNSPTWRRWNPLPISLDQIGDLTLMFCGVLYGTEHFLELPVMGKEYIGLALAVPSVALVAKLIAWIFRKFKYADTLCETFLTHISCALMIFVTVLAWHTVYYDSGIGCCGSIVTIMIFYLIFIAIGDKTRLIRARPGADRLNNR